MQDLLIRSHNHDLEDSTNLGQKPTWDELIQVENKVDKKLEEVKVKTTNKAIRQKMSRYRYLHKLEHSETTQTSTKFSKREDLK